MIVGFDFQEWGGVDAEAVVGKDAVGCGHVDHGDFAATKSEREAKTRRVVPSRNTHKLPFGDHFFDAKLREDFDGGDVVGVGQS